jgi:hypothetical protein
VDGSLWKITLTCDSAAAATAAIGLSFPSLLLFNSQTFADEFFPPSAGWPRGRLGGSVVWYGFAHHAYNLLQKQWMTEKQESKIVERNIGIRIPFPFSFLTSSFL